MRRALVALLALLGVVSLALGIAAGTVWSAADTATARASVKDPGLVVTTAPGLLEGLPGRVTVTAKGQGDAPVLLAIGRDRDVQAYVDGIPHTTLTGFDKTNPNVITTQSQPGPGQDAAQQPQQGPQIADPATSDLWVQTESGKGSATLVREPDEQQGRWVLVAAGDGATPAPTTFTFSWPQEAGNPWTVPLIVIGIVLLVAAAALAALFFWWYAIRPAKAPARIEADAPVTGEVPVAEASPAERTTTAEQATTEPATTEQATGEHPTTEQATGEQPTGGPATEELPTAAVGKPTLTADEPVQEPEPKTELQPEQQPEQPKEAP